MDRPSFSNNPYHNNWKEYPNPRSPDYNNRFQGGSQRFARGRRTQPYVPPYSHRSQKEPNSFPTNRAYQNDGQRYRQKPMGRGMEGNTPLEAPTNTKYPNNKFKNPRKSEPITPRPKDVYDEFVETVHSGAQWGNITVVLTEGQHPLATLQNSLKDLKHKIKIGQDKDDYVLCIQLGEDQPIELARGGYKNIKEAKVALGWGAVDLLHKDCFTIINKKNLLKVTGEDVNRGSVSLTDQEIQEVKTAEPPAGNSIAAKMMAKMGWGGGGLGAREQGIQEPVQVEENVDRCGLGHGQGGVMAGIRKLLEEVSRTLRLATLAFSSDFTKEERELIHKECQRLRNLRSKSYGHGDKRYITVARKWTSCEIVRELLRTPGNENQYFKLVIPDKHLELHRQMFPSLTNVESLENSDS